MIRPAQENDIEKILEIYNYARKFMREHDNPTQWSNGYPQRAIILNDIKNQKCYVYEKDSIIQAVFYFAMEEDSTYQKIYEGEWLNKQMPYAVIHRIACSENGHGIAAKCVEYCLSKCNNIRIDTHRNNYVMQKFLAKQGFVYCGIIYLENGEERLVYQKLLK